MEKTKSAYTKLVFLGILIDGENMCLVIPQEKLTKAMRMINWAQEKVKVTVKTIQQLTGVLNFLCKAIVPGRTFTSSKSL